MTEQDATPPVSEDSAQHPVDGGPPPGADEGGGGAPDVDAHAADAEQVDDVRASAEVADDPRSREELLEALAVAEFERGEYLKDLQRLQAEFENFRKRTMREGVSQRAAGVVELTGKLLDVLDDFDLALMSVDKTNDVRSLHKGLELVYSKLISTLKGAGLERIDGELVPFDPERHEAVQQVEAEDGPHEHPIVIDVLRPGYEMQGRVIRAAMVKVAQ
ncbi:MAG TPA: nucleotide exchange factor GrpE [Nitriliruptorales bacterium]